MANNRIQVKRTSTAGRTPNTTNAGNTQYIAAGEFALNMPDGILYTSNGTVLLPIGANNVNVNVSNTLTVKAISANGSNGSSGQVLTTNGTATYWASSGGTGTVTSVATGNGMTGGPITTTGTVSVLANTGIVANATGVFVNSAYIGTLSANNTTYVNGKTEGNLNVNNATTAYGKTESNLNVNAAAQLTTARTIGDVSFNGTSNIVPERINFRDTRSVDFAPFAYPGATLHLKLNGTDSLSDGGTYHGILSLAHWGDTSGGDVHQLAFTDNNNLWLRDSSNSTAWNPWIQVVTTASGNALISNNASFLGGVAAASYVQNTDSRTLSGNLIISGTSFNPSTNTILLGNSTQRWVMYGNTGDFTGSITAAAGINGISLTNTTSNWILYNNGGVNPPTTTTRSAGTKIVLYSALSGTATDYAVGIEGGTLWQSVPSTSNQFKWYGNTTNFMSANIAGLYHTGIVNAASHTVGTSFTANSTVVNAVSYKVGSFVVANSTVVNATHLNGTAAASYVQNTDSRTLSGNLVFTANVTLKSIIANGSLGTAGQVLTSNATTVYWSTVAAAGGGYYKGGTAAVGTLAAGGQNIFRVNANTLNTNTTFVAGENGQATGPITVSAGVTLTVESGARVSIV